MQLRHRALGALATAAIAAGAVTFLPSSAPAANAAAVGDPVDVVGRNTPGFTLISDARNFGTGLYEVRINGEVTTQSYCIEATVFLDTTTSQARESSLQPWSEFKGANKFKTDPEVRASVSWITRNSYPAVSLDALESATGVADLSEKEAIVATQAAIWNLTDDVQWRGLAGGATAEDAADAKVLFDYLRGPANVGAPENTGTDSLDVSISGPTSVTPGETAGPFTVTAPTTAALVLPAGLTAVDADGNPISLDAVAAGSQFFVKVPADAAIADTFEITATAKAVSLSSFIIFTPPNPKWNFDHQQTIIVADDATRTASTTFAMTVTTPSPTPTATPTETPTDTPSPTPTVSTNPPSTTVPATPGMPGQPTSTPGTPPLATTGADAGPAIIGGVLALALAAGGFLLRRRANA